MAADIYVIVTAHNEADRLGATLRALAPAFPGAPVLLADDGSTDATPETALLAGARVVRSERVIGKGGAATEAARNALRDARIDAGADEQGASGEHEVIFVLCDADLGESAGQLGELAQAVRRGQADMTVAAFARRAGGGFGLAVGFARGAVRQRCGLR